MTDLVVGFAIAIAATEAVAIAGILLQYTREGDAWRAERKDLLNRIMARSYAEFVYNTKEQDEPTQLTTDEIEAKWYEAQARETGTPALDESVA